MKLIIVLMMNVTLNFAHANIIDIGNVPKSKTCPQGMHLGCAPQLAGGCSNQICVADAARPANPICDDTSFQVIGNKVDGELCGSNIFYPGCSRTSEQDAQVNAGKECYPASSKRVSPWTIINPNQIEADFTCCD